jgi:anti-sigma B factor antagonist
MADGKYLIQGDTEMYTQSPVIVLQLPEILKRSEADNFFKDFRPLLEGDRPCVVLDCSLMQSMDSSGVEMLLHCLQETMKRDGDLKLAAVSPATAVILELMRVDRLFEIFETTEQAVRSFQTFAPAASYQTQPWYAAEGLPDLKIAS